MFVMAKQKTLSILAEVARLIAALLAGLAGGAI